MAESSIRQPAGQLGDRIRTSTKVIGGNTVHSPYLVEDTPWSILGSYYWSEYFSGSTGSGSAGILFGIARTFTVPGVKEMIVRKVKITYYNEGVSAANRVYMQRTLLLPAAASPVSKTLYGVKSTKDAVGVATPSATADIFVKPSLGAGTLESLGKVPVLVKPSTVGAIGTTVIDLTDPDEPYFLLGANGAEQQGLVFYQDLAGTTTEHWMVSIEWHEIIP